LPFLVLSGVAALSLTAVAFLLPSMHPGESHAARGAEPDRRHFYFLMATTVLVVSGFFTVYTYITALLTKTSGVASAMGVASTGMLFDRHARALSIAPFFLLAVGLLGLWALRADPLAAVAMSALANLGLGCLVIANQSQVLVVAPGSSDVASAWAGASFNVGIGAGSLVGGLVLPSFGPPGTALTAGLFASSALVLAVANHAGRARGGRQAVLAGSGASVDG
jgi:DHA1 family inner membrane transport protein